VIDSALDRRRHAVPIGMRAVLCSCATAPAGRSRWPGGRGSCSTTGHRAQDRSSERLEGLA